MEKQSALGIAVATALLASACTDGSSNPSAPQQEQGADETQQPDGAAGWSSRVGEDGAWLTFTAADGAPLIRLHCPAKENRLLVNVPGFRPIGSEDRLSFGGGGQAVALVADASGDTERGGVTGAGPQPDELKELLVAGPISASYGSQQSGPHPRPPDSAAAPFLSACLEAATAAREAAARPNDDTHPCHVQGDRLVQFEMRALGTEPFWNAKINGRCVTYSSPENLQGTRIWTQVSDGPDGPIFTGAYKGEPFRLALRPSPGCSDGMSDRRYDWAARLTVQGEERRGCAETMPSGR